MKGKSYVKYAEAYFILCIFFCTFTSFTIALSQEILDSLKYLGLPRPGLTPEVFAPGVVSLNNRIEFNTTFSPAGNEFYFTVCSVSWSNYSVKCMKLKNGQWIGPETPVFCSSNSDDLEASFSPDGQILYFTSGRPPSGIWDIWKTVRSENGWTEPEHLGDPINTAGYENYAFITETGAFYFISSRPGTDYKFDIFRTAPTDGQYLTVESLGDSINSIYNEFDPFVAPDESYIIFSSNRPGGYGKTDLYISYRKDDHTWTEAKNLGKRFNTSQGEGGGPKISPDGRYFFFARYEGTKCDIYWVDARALDELRPANIKSKTKSGSFKFNLNRNYSNPFNPVIEIR